MLDVRSVGAAITRNSYVKWGLAIVLACGVSFLAGRMTAPGTVTTTEVTKTQEKTSEVNKTANKKTSETKENRDVTTTTTEKINPDGSKEIQTVTVDKTKVDTGSTESSKTSTAKTSEKTTTKTETTVVDNGKKWHLSLLAGVTTDEAYRAVTELSRPTIKYGGSVEYKVLGDISIGGFGLSDKTFGVSVGVSL